ncbi:MAG: hydantoinase/oxoprolinase family protein [Abditibacteriales bacterium]|nr:hydantoinase/oxoprolinase family protein [Abditibacteriales bacterium]MDW8366745.1 hydantoinase/oxoprolinase family protein [Abditibacteriales bacterium]
MRIGIDTGGTFTDLILYAESSDGQPRLLTHKVPSTPPDFSAGVLRGLRELLTGAALGQVRYDLIHGSTVATNALLERKGAKTALVTTRGFRDVLEIGRQTRAEIYNLNVERPAPLVSRPLRLEVTERVDAQGNVLTPLRASEVERVLDRLERRGVESVAVCLLFSFLHPQHEQRIAALARKRGFFVSASCEVLPEFREYERTSTTVVNAYVSPVMSRYLSQLASAAQQEGAAHVRIMQSNGGSISAQAAGARAVHTLLSGPAAGVLGALHVARQALGERPNLITFDMGGTSTDVSLCVGDVRVTTEGSVGGLPVRVPMMDIHTVGAGGGSIACVDAGGALRVGPQSAGADPGPVCYGKGEQVTVTDANLILGRIDPERFLGGRMRLDVERTRAFMSSWVQAFMRGLEVSDAARAIVRVVNSNMERAMRVISVERGYDPREFTLLSFGGAGGLHACALAESLRIPRVLIPVHPGLLSAWGCVASDVVKDFARTVMLPASERASRGVRSVFAALEREGVGTLRREGFAPNDIVLMRSLDLRYVGQSYEITTPFAGNVAATVQTFHRLHEQHYGHCAPDEPVEIVTARVRAVGRVRPPRLQPIERGTADARAAIVTRRRLGVTSEVATIYDREQLKAGNAIIGPALVVEPYATTLVPPRWRGTVDRWGNILLVNG